MQTEWEEAQEWEKTWWGSCRNTYGEEYKQLLYAHRMGLQTFHDDKSPYNFDLGGISVLDVGGGPVSLLLKCINFSRARVIDPLAFPDWVIARYKLAGIEFEQGRGEDLTEVGWGEAWIYNCLQHAEDPAQVVTNIRQAVQLIRIFEWIDTPTNEGHPHALTEVWLNEQLKGEGKVEQLTGQNECFGRCYYGVFPT